MQYGQSCLCGNSYGKYGPADNCNYPCTGDSSQMCGGYSANSVYSVGESLPVGQSLSVQITGGGVRIGLRDSVSLYSQVTGGAPPYKYLWTAPGWSAWTGEAILYDFATINAQPDRLVVNLQVTDNQNNSANAQTYIDLVATSQPLSVQISGGGVRVGLTDSVSLYSQVSGGVPPYKYLWTAPGWAAWSGDSIAYNLATVNAQPGRLVVNLQVTDSQNNSTYAETYVDLVDQGTTGGGNGGGHQRACNAEEAAAFARMTGTWKHKASEVNIGGSCENVSGTWLSIEYCESIHAPYNSNLPKYNGTFTGRIEGSALSLKWNTPASVNHAAASGTGSCYIDSSGTLGCSGLRCSSSGLSR